MFKSELDTRCVYPNQIIILISRQTKFDEFWLRSSYRHLYKSFLSS